MSGQDKTLKVGAARYCFLVDLAHVQLNYTYGLALASIQRFQLLGMKAPQFCLRVLPMPKCMHT